MRDKSGNMNPSQNWFCAQLGGREHYAVPRALQAAGALNLLLTDYWAGVGTRALAKIAPGKVFRSLAARQHPELPAGMVKSWNLKFFRWETELRQLSRRGGVVGRYRGFCKVGKQFSQAAVRHLRTHSDLPTNGVFFGYDTASLEAMEYLKARGWACIVDQTDPCRVEAEIVQAEQRDWPGWEEQALDIPDEFFERHVREWAVADRVVVNSEWSRQALVQQGVPPEKLVVIPLCYEVEADKLKTESLKSEAPERRSTETPLRVLFLGQVMLRKGIQYLVEAAKFLQNEPVRFDVVGPILISAGAVASASSNLVFHGRSTRDQTSRWYRNADVFVLPTLSDGFAITQIEAMAHGLPVIATPNCGQVVADGVDGFIVPARDPVALAGTIRRFLDEPECLKKQRCAALQKSGEFSLHRVRTALLELERQMRPARNH